MNDSILVTPATVTTNGNRGKRADNAQARRAETREALVTRRFVAPRPALSIADRRKRAAMGW